MGWVCALCDAGNVSSNFIRCASCKAPKGKKPKFVAAPAAPPTVTAPLAAPAATAARATPTAEYVARKANFGYNDEVEDSDDEREGAGAPTVRVVGDGGGGFVRCVCVGDLHRHQWDKAYWVGEGPRERQRKVDLAEWYAAHAPADVGLAIFAGDLGLEQNDELATEGVRGVDVRAKGVEETGREKERASVREWASLFKAICRARPRCHVVIVGGNHDGLLCDDDGCPACAHLDRLARSRRWETERRRHWGADARAATDAVVNALVGDFHGRVHVLREAYVDVDCVCVGGGSAQLRVLGSPLTPRVQEDITKDPDPEDCHASHNTLLAGEGLKAGSATARRWDALLGHADTTERGVVVVAHGPPMGILDLVGGASNQQRRVGCEAFADALARHRAPAFVVFGHVHAKQSASEEGARLCVSRKHPGTLFANAASETGTATISGYRLMRKDTKFDHMDILRPPTVVDVPVRGFREAGGPAFWPPAAPRPSDEPPTLDAAPPRDDSDDDASPAPPSAVTDSPSSEPPEDYVIARKEAELAALKRRLARAAAASSP